MSDSKLKEARAQITKLCKRLDIACHVVLHNAPGKSELFFAITPSYSKVRINIVQDGLDGKGGAEVRLLSKSEQYGGDKEAQRRDLEATANMVSSFGELLGNHAILFLEASKIIDRETGAEHGGLEKTEPPEGEQGH